MLLSIVISVYNEDTNIALIYSELIKAMPKFHEILFVDDGSTDNSRNEIKNLCEVDISVKALFFSKNYGHEAAMKAGLDAAKGDIIVFMDCDLQHPPELIPFLLEFFKYGYEIVLPQRRRTIGQSIIKNIFVRFFYRLMNFISKETYEVGVSDFFVISQKVKNIIQQNYPERVLFLRGIIQNVGFNKKYVEYDAPNRINGKSKYSLFRLILMSFSALATNSKISLKLGISFGFLFSILGFIITFYSLIMKFYANPVSGYTTLAILISFSFSFLFIFLGIIAEYIGIIFDEIKERPIYIVEQKIN